MTKNVEVIEEVELETEIEETQTFVEEEAEFHDAAEQEEPMEAGPQADFEDESDEEHEKETEDTSPEITYDVSDPTAPWLISCIESLVFASTQPLTVTRVVEVLKGERIKIEKDIVRKAFTSLLETWTTPERNLATGFQLVEVAKGLSFRTVMDNASFIRRFFAERPQRLTRAQLETLAIISYRQPATRGQVEEIRGVDCGSALRTLLDKNLIKVLGKSEEIGRPWIYGTTKYFLSFFALKSLHDLPPLQEVQELDAENTEKLRSILGDTDEESVIFELFDPEKQGKLVSTDTEQLSQDALTDLESAVGYANKVMKRVNDGPPSKETPEHPQEDTPQVGPTEISP